MVSTQVINALRLSALICTENLCFDDSQMLLTFLDFVEIIFFFWFGGVVYLEARLR